MDITQYTTFDSPVPYRNILIYPVTVRDYLMFSALSQCLLIEKNIISDAKIISMSNLEYLYHISLIEDESRIPYILWFDRLLAMVLRDESSFESMEESVRRYNYNEKSKPIFTIGKEIYASKDFEELKKIICEQNLVEIPNPNISKEVRDSFEKAKEYKRKMSGGKVGTLEDYIISLASVTGWSLEYIYGLTVRKFNKAVRRYDNFVHYKIYLAASMSGMVEFKDKSFIKHWLMDIDEEEEYKDVSMDLDSLQDKISFKSAKAEATANAEK